MKKQILTLTLLTMTLICYSQIQNGTFEEWDFYNGREKPAEWHCPNLCPSPTCGPCDKITKSEDDLAVRIHNVMPCVDQGEAKSRSAGFIEDYFSPNQSAFNISFDVSIDSIIEPASFIFTLKGSELDSTISWSVDELGDFSYSKNIYLNEPYDSLFIQFKSQGYPVENNQHACDLGYISGIIDNVKLSEIVSIENALPIDIEVFPNPFSGEIQILTDNQEIPTFQLFDIKGRRLFTGSGNHLIPNPEILNGIYILKIKVGDTLITKKVIKR